MADSGDHSEIEELSEFIIELLLVAHFAISILKREYGWLALLVFVPFLLHFNIFKLGIKMDQEAFVIANYHHVKWMLMLGQRPPDLSPGVRLLSFPCY
jgi:hypothetical protein